MNSSSNNTNNNKHSKRIAKYIDELCLFDDRFMQIVFEHNYEASEYVLNVIFNRNDLKVKEINTQVNITSSSIKDKFIALDILAFDESGKAYDIEIQKANESYLAKRARYYSSLLDTKLLKQGQDYNKLKDSYIIFICENDVLKAKKALYHIDRSINELNNKSFNDGSHIIYINGAYKDVNTTLGQLVHDFKCTKTSEIYSDILRKHVGYYKDNNNNNNGGNKYMGDTFERFAEEIRKENTEEVTKEVTEKVTNEVTEKVTNEVREQNTKEVKFESIKNIMKSLKLTVEQAMDALNIIGEERNYYLARLQSTEH